MNQKDNYGFHRNWASLLSFTAIYLPDAHIDFPTITCLILTYFS